MNDKTQLVLLQSEEEFYSQHQKEVLQEKKKSSYATVRNKFGFTSNQQLENFLFRTLLGFKLEDNEGPCGPIPLVPEIITPQFVEVCYQHTIELDCIYTYKALRILEDLLSERAFRGYMLASELNCSTLAFKIIERLDEIYLSSQWFSNYCSSHGLKVVNPQTLQNIRRKYCHSRVMQNFYSYIKNLVHDNEHLIYNVDETSCVCNRKGKIVIPDGKYLPFVGEEQAIGHITAVLCCNAAGETLKPLIILPALLKLPNELIDLQSQCIFASTPSGWMTSNIFLIWCLFFAAEINRRRGLLSQIKGSESLKQPCLLFLDGHKSRINSIALEILYKNNIKVIVLPAHSYLLTYGFPEPGVSPPFLLQANEKGGCKKNDWVSNQ